MMGSSDAMLSPAEADALRRIAGLMIPASEEYNVPGADDPVIFNDIVKSLGRDTADVRAALTELAALDDIADAEEAAASLQTVGSAHVATLGRVILQCYYRDDRVLRALGIEPRPPFPKGHVVDQGDWSLLDPVRSRSAFWRNDRVM